jgi:hypothetical protein
VLCPGGIDSKKALDAGSISLDRKDEGYFLRILVILVANQI